MIQESSEFSGTWQLLQRLPEAVRERMVRMYVDALGAQVAALRDALAAGDWKQAEHLSHKLAGSAGMMQDAALSQAGRRIENLLREGCEAEAADGWPLLSQRAECTLRWLREAYPGWT